MKKFLVTFCSTFCYVGFLPFIPGTFGSLAGIGVYLLVKDNPVAYLCAVCACVAAGFATGGAAEKVFGVKDPKYVVIDEVAGMLICLWGVAYSPMLTAIGFIFFRLLDTVKPFPAYQLQKLRGSAGIMVDDLVAGVYGMLCLQGMARLISVMGS